MTKRIRTSEPALKRIRDTGASLPRIEASCVAAGLGAEVSAEKRWGRGWGLTRGRGCLTNPPAGRIQGATR